jgi:DNA primase
VCYYLAVAEGALRGAGGRPNMLVRYARGIRAPGLTAAGDGAKILT